MSKGAGLEELARAYFARQGYVAIRSVWVRFEDEDVTDVDVWLYGHQSDAVRTRAIIDVKDKKSPKAFERIMWTRGMQLALNCDRGFVTTTINNPKVARFAQQQNVSLLTAGYLRASLGEAALKDRLSLEELQENIKSFSGQKQDGDWIKQIEAGKSAVVSLAPFPAFNQAMNSFRFFSERVATRPQHREQALRGSYLTAAFACIALDSALANLAFEQPKVRHQILYSGVTYGDEGDNRVRHSIETVLSVIAKGVNNGRAIARQAGDALDLMFTSVRGDIIAEFFAREQNSAPLFRVARELEARAHARSRDSLTNLSIEAKSVLGVFADFVGARRTALFSNDFSSSIGRSSIGTVEQGTSGDTTSPTQEGDRDKKTSSAEEIKNKSERSTDNPEPKLL